MTDLLMLLTSPVVWVMLLVAVLYNVIKVMREYERAVVFTLGKFWKVSGPGLIILIPVVQQMVKVSLRTVVMDVPTQDVITRDNVSVKVNAVIYFRVVDPQRAIVNVEDFLYATSQVAQTTLRSVLGGAEMDELLSERDAINQKLQEILDRQTDAWGVKVSAVEVKHVDLPQEMQRAMAKQAESERERRAKVIHAEGEFQASQKLADASQIMAEHPMALQLRYLQTLTEMTSDKSSTIVVPLPLDLIRPFLEKADSKDKKTG
ncbi:MAG: slipin family protein [Nitrospirota bacterium]|nr:slipin family protein [Nitrospirota bacterium]